MDQLEVVIGFGLRENMFHGFLDVLLDLGRLALLCSLCFKDLQKDNITAQVEAVNVVVLVVFLFDSGLDFGQSLDSGSQIPRGEI